MNNTRLRNAGGTHIGGRENNEDCFGILADGQLIVVADGMGGHAGGDRASSEAVDSVSSDSSDGWLKNAEKASLDPQDIEVKAMLLEMIARANTRISVLNAGATGLERMGTTVTLSFITGKWLHISWVGDSRVYLLRGKVLTQLNDDHTINYELYRLGKMTKEALRADTSGRGSNVITRSLGGPSVVADYLKVALEDGDIVLCCSDGLNNSLTPDELQQQLSLQAKVEEITASLLNEALKAGARDNVTAVVTKVAIEGEKVSGRGWLQALRQWLPF